MPRISPARLAAFEILAKIETEKSFSSLVLPYYEENLAPDDRALCHQITLGVLRSQIYLDKIIENFTKNKKLDAAIKIALQIGLYQLIFLDKIPAYSAINESVNLVQKAKKTSAKGFVNAVLRRATREKIELTFADEIERISIETSHPRWLIERWIAQFGFEETEKLATVNNNIPKISFRLTAKFFRKDAKAQSEALTGIEGRFERSKYVENCFIAEKYNAELFALAETGEIYFQDEGSQMVGQTVNLKKGESFWDVCAAPGSKTTQIAIQDSRFKNENLLVAGDLYFQRLDFLKENCRRQAIDFVGLVQYDAEKSLPFADGSFDCVLLDAPCSGTGTIRHNPEIRYFLNEKDFAALSAKQLVILENASKLVKKGGKLIYSTCSLETEENETVCQRFQAKNQDFILTKPDLPQRFITTESFARTFPPRDEMDGFFIAVYERT
jgi:16S rRNA (cytosine967-C5)-methyltransferase